MTDAAQSASSILIIDADLESLELLSNALARPGLRILTGSTSENGLDLFCSQRPQIVSLS
jgi:DNA-binding response OmpR family regulator